MITFTLFEAAYGEIMRAGIQSIARGQVSASMALGLTSWQGMRYVVLPQAFRNMVPALLTRVIDPGSRIRRWCERAVADRSPPARQDRPARRPPGEPHLFVAVVYFIICFTASRLVKRLEKRTRVLR